MRRIERWAMPLGLLLASGIFNLAYTMLIPLVQILRTRFTMEPWEIGLAFGGFALSKALLQPVGGFLVDRIKPLPTAVGGLLLVAMSLTGLGGATSGFSIILWRLIWGASEGITMPGLYKLVGIVAKRSRLKEATLMGWFGSAAVSGMATGVLLAGFVYEQVGYRGTFFIGALFALLSAITLWTSVRRVATDHELIAPVNVEDNETIRPAITQFKYLFFIAIMMGLLDSFNNGLYGAIEPILPLRIGILSQNPVRTTSILFFVGLVVFAIASGLMGRVLQRFNPYTPIVIAFLVSSLTLFGMRSASNMTLIGISFVVFNIAQPAVYIATRKTLIAFPERFQGRALGLFGFLSDLGFILGPIVATLLWTSVREASLTVLGIATAVVAAATYPLARRFVAKEALQI
jgi:MFS transporter, DHA1 family, multidrug resistance protein